MKKVIWLALLMPFSAFGQIVENFESGSIVNWVQSNTGRWKADTIESISGNLSLHHVFDNPDAGNDRIGIKIQNLHPSEGPIRWSFLIRHGYDPSSLNNWSVFLMSDKSPDSMAPEEGAKGFAVGVNLTGSDDTLRLWKIKDNTIIPVVNCGINWQTDIGITGAVKVSVERSASGNWTVAVSRLTGVIIATRSSTDNELFIPAWFGIYYRYSSTRDRLIWLDDITLSGVFYEDTTAPSVAGIVPAGTNKLKISFSEEPDSQFMIPENFSLNATENKAVSVLKKNNLDFEVVFAGQFKNKKGNTLNINKICDKSGNCLQSVKLSFTPLWAEAGDIIISEIMADPLPEVSLPGKEYIEITNRTDFSFNLENWRLSTTSQYSLLPAVSIPPSGIMIICAIQDTSLFKTQGRTTGIKQFPSLTDEGRLIYISDSTGVFVHGVEYCSSWYNDELKKQGGWSLEMIDTGYPFYDIGNWTASVSKKGGTPGIPNSVAATNQDISFYGIKNVFALDSTSIRLEFTEPVFNFLEIAGEIKAGDRSISGYYQSDPMFREFILNINKPLKRNKVYTLELPSALSDFAGNRGEKLSFSFGLAEQASSGDILFNEILFNPLPGDPDYLEFYNISEKIIDASRLEIVSMNNDTGDKSEAVMLSDQSRCFLPGEYYAVTTDKKKITDRYLSSDPEHIFKTGSMPSMPDDKGHLILYNRELDIIDEFQYSDDMHYSMLSSDEGVALEKNNPGNKSGERSGWHSASEISGWGTPGTVNSIYADIPATSDNVVFSSTKISPDDDGYEDLLTISMNLKGEGNVVSVTIFDETGSLVNKLAKNLFAGAKANLTWDGTADDGSMVRTGIYIILISVYDDSGKTEKWKTVCSVIR